MIPVASFSEGITPVKVEGGTAQIGEGRVTFNPIRRIGPGEEVVLKIHARGEAAGSHVIRMEVQCTEPETQLVRNRPLDSSEIWLTRRESRRSRNLRLLLSD